jgi:hypothetical protein
MLVENPQTMANKTFQPYRPEDPEDSLASPASHQVDSVRLAPLFTSVP